MKTDEIKIKMIKNEAFQEIINRLITLSKMRVKEIEKTGMNDSHTKGAHYDSKLIVGKYMSAYLSCMSRKTLKNIRIISLLGIGKSDTEDILRLVKNERDKPAIIDFILRSVTLHDDLAKGMALLGIDISKDVLQEKTEHFYDHDPEDKEEEEEEKEAEEEEEEID